MPDTVPVALDAAQAARLEIIARTRELAPQEVLSEAVAAYLAHHDWFVAEVEKGRESARVGPLRDFVEFAAEMRARMKAAVLQAAE